MWYFVVIPPVSLPPPLPPPRFFYNLFFFFSTADILPSSLYSHLDDHVFSDGHECVSRSRQDLRGSVDTNNVHSTIVAVSFLFFAYVLIFSLSLSPPAPYLSLSLSLVTADFFLKKTKKNYSRSTLLPLHPSFDYLPLN